MIVVDNNSEDETTAVAREKGATVVHEPVRGVARARNTEARYAESDVLVFVDADVIMPPKLLDMIHAAMSDPACVGGAVHVDYRPQRLFMRLYLRAWQLLARLTGMAQGATQFCRQSATVRWASLRNGDCILYPGVGMFVLIRPAQTRESYL